LSLFLLLPFLLSSSPFGVILTTFDAIATVVAVATIVAVATVVVVPADAAALAAFVVALAVDATTVFAIAVA